MSSAPAKRSPLRLILFAGIELLLLAGCWWGINYQMDLMNRTVNDISELRDPSPFRAALMGYLGKIHLGLEGYLRSSDNALLEQVTQSRNDFDAALPEFERQNPKLFPKIAVEEISRGFGVFKESIAQTLLAHQKRASRRNALERNFADIISLIERNLRPLIRNDQGEGEERKDAILNVENQARAWQQNLATTWAHPAQSGMEMTFENDNRGATYLDRYARMELLTRERKVLKEIRGLWQATSDLSRESFALEKIVDESEKFMNSQRELVVAALNKYLPAMPPAELDARKQGFVRAIRLYSAATFFLGCIGLGSLIFLAIGAYRMTPRGAADHQAATEAAHIKEKQQVKSTEPEDPTLHMDLKGVITRWSPQAQTLYGYSDREILGKAVSKLFESESEISRLYKDLLEAPQTVFQTTHRTHDGTIFRVRIEFRPVIDSSGHPVAIGLVCSRK